jgi:hypothetical protein
LAWDTVEDEGALRGEIISAFEWAFMQLCMLALKDVAPCLTSDMAFEMDYARARG